LPSAYHEVYIDHPENYPKNFIIDFNGKRLPWEALVILPFVHEDELRSYEENKRKKYSKENKSNLNDEEKSKIISDYDIKRNGYGEHWLYQKDKKTNYIPAVTFFKFIDFSDCFFN
jgi:5'-3' exonuclease